MKNETVNLTKFEDIQQELKELEVRYKNASEKDDKEELTKINNRYKELRTLLFSCENYYKNIYNAEKLKEEIELEDDDSIIDELQSELTDKNYEKKLFKKNKAYISILDKAPSIEEYANNTKKKLNFVQRNIVPIVLATALLVGGGVVLSSCGKSNNNKNTIKTTTEATTEDNNDLITSSTTEVTTQAMTDDVKIIDSTEGVTITDVTPGNPINNLGVKIINNDFKGGETIEAQDPHVSNAGSGTQTTVHEEVKSEQPATEPAPQDYEFNEETTQSLIPKEEIVHYEEKEENQETDTTDRKQDGEKEAKEQEIIDYEETTQSPIPSEEIIYYEYEDNTEETNTTNIPIEEDETESKNVESTQSSTDVYEDNLPIEEDEAIINDLTESKGYTLALSYRG